MGAQQIDLVTVPALTGRDGVGSWVFGRKRVVCLLAIVGFSWFGHTRRRKYLVCVVVICAVAYYKIKINFILIFNGRIKIRISMWRNRFRGFRWRWIQIWWSRNKTREELRKSILKFWKSNSWRQNSKIEIKFHVLRCRFFIFPSADVSISYFSGIQILKKNSNLWPSPVYVFSPNFDPKFWFFRVVVQNVPSHLAKYPNYFSIFSSTVWHGNARKTIHTATDNWPRGKPGTSSIEWVPNTKSIFWSKKNLNFEAKM